MLRIALVEDDAEYQKILEGYVKQYFREMGEPENYTLRIFGDGDEILREYRAEYDIILMDIQMQMVDGMTAAETIRRSDSQVVIIFITSLATYAVQGYSVDALSYLLKPVNYFAFAQSMRRARERLQRRSKHYHLISGKDGVRRLDCGCIYYIEVVDRSLVYHTSEGEIQASGSMREAEASLEGLPFFRCNKGILLNLEHVEQLSEEDAVVHGQRVQVSRAKRKALLDALNRYINEVGP